MINLYDIKPGDRLRLKDGRIGAVVENMGDGQWVEVCFDGQDEHEEPELVHSQDISELLTSED